MRFPGARILSKDISTRAIPLEVLIRENEEAALSGYVEIVFGDGEESTFLFHRGKVVILIHRCETAITTYREALIHLWKATQTMEGKVWISELPGDMAHMLRGLTDRQEIGQLAGSGSLKGLMKRLEAENHTGSLEVVSDVGNGIFLLEHGQLTNCYFETEEGATSQDQAALDLIYEILDRRSNEVRFYTSVFSPEVFGTRQYWNIWEDLDQIRTIH